MNDGQMGEWVDRWMRDGQLKMEMDRMKDG